VSPIRETRLLLIENKVIKPSDIRTLARIVTDASEELKIPKSKQRFSFEIKAHGLRLYESEDAELFEQDSILDSKQIFAITMLFADRETGSRIFISLEHGNSHGDDRNYVSVGGTNSTWVSGVVHKLEEAISEFEKQTSWPRKWEVPLMVIAALGCGRAFDIAGGFILSHLFYIQPLTPRPHWADLMQPLIRSVRWATIFLIGLFPSFVLTKKLMELWPSVELRMGHEWAQVSKTRRDRLWLFVTIGVLPLLLSLLYDGLKAIFWH
jgi:hypothetical protein